MRNYLSTLKKSAGFTLIELLVVIGILGVLATALIATIDPFEQLRKADDANVKNTSVEFINANIRYYTTHSAMPWYNSAAAGCYALSASVTNGVTLNSVTACAQELVADAELKAGFTTVTGILQKIIVKGTANSVTACFNPASKSQLRDANTKYSSLGSEMASGTCLGNGGTAETCYWCSF